MFGGALIAEQGIGGVEARGSGGSDQQFLDQPFKLIKSGTLKEYVYSSRVASRAELWNRITDKCNVIRKQSTVIEKSRLQFSTKNKFMPDRKRDHFCCLITLLSINAGKHSPIPAADSDGLISHPRLQQKLGSGDGRKFILSQNLSNNEPPGKSVELIEISNGPLDDSERVCQHWDSPQVDGFDKIASRQKRIQQLCHAALVFLLEFFLQLCVVDPAVLTHSQQSNIKLCMQLVHNTALLNESGLWPSERSNRND
ncbi:hypothetical protein NQ318_023017 [Aromia moschata]|uniref:Uncharacterized protein n=1 Tax=Aromia moschata TaxID=1265417 RepID=A0AAV8YBM2_9CUCU|nr:hypothetical protein NQ318_023017 [Aromia moschata]